MAAPAANAVTWGGDRHRCTDPAPNASLVQLPPCLSILASWSRFPSLCSLLAPSCSILPSRMRAQSSLPTQQPFSLPATSVHSAHKPLSLGPFSPYALLSSSLSPRCAIVAIVTRSSVGDSLLIFPSFPRPASPSPSPPLSSSFPTRSSQTLVNERALFLKTIVLKSPPARTFTSRAVFELLLIDVDKEDERREKREREEERRGETKRKRRRRQRTRSRAR